MSVEAILIGVCAFFLTLVGGSVVLLRRLDREEKQWDDKHEERMRRLRRWE